MIKSEDYLNSLMVEYLEKKDKAKKINEEVLELSSKIKSIFIENNIIQRTLDNKKIYIQEKKSYKYPERAKFFEDTIVSKIKILYTKDLSKKEWWSNPIMRRVISKKIKESKNKKIVIHTPPLI